MRVTYRVIVTFDYVFCLLIVQSYVISDISTNYCLFWRFFIPDCAQIGKIIELRAGSTGREKRRAFRVCYKADSLTYQFLRLHRQDRRA